MNMTHTTARRPIAATRYPNAAAPGYFLQKFADGLLCAASGLGIVTAFFFILTM